MGKIIFYGLVGIFLVVGFTGCKNNKVQKEVNMEEHKAMQQKGAGNQTQMGEMKNGAMQQDNLVIRKVMKDEIGKAVVCPVMGVKFSVKANTDVADYKGKSYYFCCEACPPEFKKNPEKYIS